METPNTGSVQDVPWHNDLTIEGLNKLLPRELAAKLAGLIKTIATQPTDAIATVNHMSRILRLEDRTTSVTPEPAVGPVNQSVVRGEWLPPAINPGAFLVHKKTGETVKSDTARQYKKRAIESVTDNLKGVLDKTLTLDQQALAVTVALQRKEPQVAELMGLLGESAKEKTKASTAVSMIDSMAELLNTKGCMGASTNDSLRFQSNVFLSIAPEAPEETATEEEKLSHQKQLKEIARVLGIKTATVKKRLANQSLARRNLMAEIRKGEKGSFLQGFKRATRRIWTDEKIREMHYWLLHSCSKVVANPNMKETIKIDDPDNPGKKKEVAKYLYTFSVEELHKKSMIKSVRQGGWAGARLANGKYISKSFLAKHLPKNLKRMTESHKRLCGCSICIDAKGFMVALKTWRRMYMSFLNKKVEIAKSTEGMSTADVAVLEADAAAYKQAVFIPNPEEGEPDKPVWDTLKDPMRLLTCPGFDDGIFHESGLFPLACALKRCDNCPKSLAPFPCEDIQWGDDGICDQNHCAWKYYDGRYECKQHGLIPKGMTWCMPCKAIPEEKPDKKPQRIMHYCKGRAPIGNFIHEDLIDLIGKYRYHLLLVILLGRDWCIRYRLATYFLIVGSVLVVRDYTDRLNVVKNDMSQNFGMSNREAIGIEGIAAKFFENGKEILEFFSYLSDWKVQNAKTSFVNTCLMITHLQGRGQLPKGTDATLYEQSDGCSAQYTSGTAIWCNIMLANRFRININKMITAPQHGKCICDAVTGCDKAYCGKHFLTADLEGKELDNTTVDENGGKVDIVQQLTALLGDPDRFKGKGKRLIAKRHYQGIDWSNIECPIPTTTFKVQKGSFPTAKITHDDGTQSTQPHNGSRDYHHLYASWRIPCLNSCMMRRIPCACSPCHEQISAPWDENIPDSDWTTQPRFKNPEDCELSPVLTNLNDWVCVTVEPVPGSVAYEKELEAVYNQVLHQYEEDAVENIKIGGFGAVETEKDKQYAPEGYYLVQWTGEPYLLTEPTTVEGCGQLPVRTHTCARDGIMIRCIEPNTGSCRIQRLKRPSSASSMWWLQPYQWRHSPKMAISPLLKLGKD